MLVIYRAVIFDLFGTLVRNFSYRAHEQTVSDIARILNLPRDAFARLWHETWKMRSTGVFPTIEANIVHTCAVLGLRREPDQILAGAQVELEFTRRALAPRLDAEATIRGLRERNYKIGLVSDCSPAVPRAWQMTRLAPLIDAPVFSCVVGVKKPDPVIYMLVCEQLAVSPCECLYVGDGSSRELTGAAQVGMHAVLFHVPHEDTYDDRREDVESWSGPAVRTLADVLTVAR
jgi:putative hydrolase of the HAD superfamily